VNKLTRVFLFSALAGVVSAEGSALAEPNRGFELNRYQPTAAGEWSFAVDHPWYSSTRYFAAGITLNYGHKPLVTGSIDENGAFRETQSLINHLFLAHLDLAGSFLDRVLITASLPVVLMSAGDPQFASGAAVGDLRLGGKVRLYGQPYASTFSASVGLDFWVPFRAMSDSLPPTASDLSVRVLPKLTLGGVWKKLLWSGTVGFLFRPEAITVAPPGYASNLGRAASELQFGLSAAYFDQERRFAIGPELILTAAAAGEDSFSRFGTSLEMLLAAHYNIAKIIQTGLAVGAGFVRQPGTPDVRVLARVAYAPMRDACPDSDHDGICDSKDACPQIKGVRTGTPHNHGCPAELPQAPTVQLARLEVLKSGDGTGMVTSDVPGVVCGAFCTSDFPVGTRVTLVAQTSPSSDFTGWSGPCSGLDVCTVTLQNVTQVGAHFKLKPNQGMIEVRKIGDGQGQVISDPPGLDCGSQCTSGYVQGQTVLLTAIPDKVSKFGGWQGVKGCGKQPTCRVTITPDMVKKPEITVAEFHTFLSPCDLKVKEIVRFAVGKADIDQSSHEFLNHVVRVLVENPELSLRVEGNTDTQPFQDRCDKHDLNPWLSQMRADEVRTYLIRAGISEQRLTSIGYGSSNPKVKNDTPAHMQENRRTEFQRTDAAAAQCPNFAVRPHPAVTGPGACANINRPRPPAAAK
jgi:outer membrane protein OmpA-like peptidoglycan-associated protein